MQVIASNLQTVVLDTLSISYTGFIYIPGARAGNESALRLLKNWNTEGPEAASSKVLGRFLATVTDTQRFISHTFVDNSGMFPAYFASGYISDSLRTLILNPSIRVKVDIDNVIEFLLYGFNAKDRTLTQEIRRLGGTEILESFQSSTRLISKALPDLSEEPATNSSFLYESFESFADSTRHLSLSADLTGGLDSRLIASYMSRGGAEFETALSAFPDRKDALVAKQVAQTLDRPFFLTLPPSGSALDFKQLYEASDGTFGNLEAIARKGQLQQERVNRHIDLSWDGAGGELYKDSWWIQDFPLYSRPKPNISRLYNSHIASTRLPMMLVPAESRDLLLKNRTRFIDELRAVPGSYNTEVYDRICFSYMQAMAALLNAATRRLTGMESYSPLLEFDRVRFSFSLPRRSRAFDHFHRREISTYAPILATIRTNTGTPVSIGPKAAAKLTHAYSTNIMKRAGNKLSQRLIGKRLMELEAPGNSTQLVQLLLASNAYREARAVLENLRIIDRHVDDSLISPTYLMRILVAGSACAEIQHHKSSH